MPGVKRTVGGVLGGLVGFVGLSAVAGVLVSAAVTPAVAIGGYTASSAVSIFESLPAYLEVDAPMQPTEIYAKDQDGNDFLLTSYYDQNRVPVAYDDVPQVMYDALLSSEDRRFYEHGGVDLIGTVRALVSNSSSGTTQGGSSISQQYVKNVQIQKCEQKSETDEETKACYTDATQAKGTEGYERKLQEMRYAITMEQRYTKEEILIGYLNLVNFGGTTYGIEAAAERYYGKSVGDLTLNEAATLAGMVQNPNTYRIDLPDGSYTQDDGTVVNSEADGYALAKDRRDGVLSGMLRDGKITQEQYDTTKAEPITPNITYRESGCGAAGGSAYFCQYVMQSLINEDRYASLLGDDRWETIRRGGFKVYTSLDFNVQMPAEQAMTSLVPASVDGMNLGGATASIQASTGRILSITQNTKFNESDSAGVGETSLVYAADATHGNASGFSAGSTYKVFTLIDWLEKGHSINENLNGVNRVFSPYTACGATVSNEKKIGNFNNVAGSVGTVTKFTSQSLNSGFLAMAMQLDICDINNVAQRMGVTLGNGGSVTDENVLNNVIGDKAIAPLTMASVYATIGNDGIRCEPHAIDSIIDAEGNEVELPEAKCERVIESNIAATAAAALKTVMASGGTGSQGNPGDGTELIGKTGTHENIQTMIMESSTAAATGVWVGNVSAYDGETPLARDEKDNVLLNRVYPIDRPASDIRYALGAAVQGAVDAAYPANSFPSPDPNLIKVTYKDVPNVIGMSVDEATSVLRAAGFSVSVGAAVPGSQPEGLIQEYSPSGQAAAGSVITISPSNGQGSEVPDVSGLSVQAAFAALNGAGFSQVSLGSCQADDGAEGTIATGTDPAAGSLVEQNTAVKVNYRAKSCDGGQAGNDGGDN